MQPDVQRLMNPSVSMIATAATLAGLATAAGVPTTAAAFASTAAVAARARWSNNGSSGNPLPVVQQPQERISDSAVLASPPSTSLLGAADAALQRARCAASRWRSPPCTHG